MIRFTTQIAHMHYNNFLPRARDSTELVFFLLPSSLGRCILRPTGIVAFFCIHCVILFGWDIRVPGEAITQL